MKFETLDAFTVHSIGGGWGQEIEDEGHTECVAVIRGTDIPKLALGDTTSVPVRWETSSKVRTRLLQYGDIVMEVSGGSAATGQHTGRAVFITREILEKLGGRVIPASFCRLLRLDSEKIYPKYISYQISNMHLTEEIALFENQSTGISNFQFTRFLSTIYPLTNDLQKQLSIANFFDSLDRQIITLQQINSSLESIAKAIFQSWFVDFDPVRAKLDGVNPYGLDDKTALLFSESFQSTLVGHIPKNWTLGKVSDVATINRDTINPGNFPLEEFDHYSLPSFDNQRTPKRELGREIMSNKFVISPNSVLLSKLNPHIPRTWLPEFSPSRRSICSTEFIVAISKPKYSREYLYSLFTSSSFENIYGTLVTGTTGSHQRVSPDSFLEMKIVIPPLQLIEEFTKKVKPIFDCINCNIAESQTLSSLRDTLLPKLLSGELSVESL